MREKQGGNMAQAELNVTLERLMQAKKQKEMLEQGDNLYITGRELGILLHLYPQLRISARGSNNMKYLNVAIDQIATHFV
jgi:hypothetical protein